MVLWRSPSASATSVSRTRSALASSTMAASAFALPAWANDALWALLQKGGQVVLIRHGLTTPGFGDPPGFELGECATQRNLVDEGRREAERLGTALRARKVPVARVVSSPWCRCIETARIAFGSVGPRPLLRVDESGTLADPSASDDAIDAILEGLLADAAPSATSMRASPDYRLAMLRVLARRARATALERLRG